MGYPSYLVHYNKNHSNKNGQFVSGDGDGDGIADEHHRYTKREAKNKKRVNNEIAFQNRKISDLKKRRQAYDDSLASVKKSGRSELLKAGYDSKTADKAVQEFTKKYQTERDWVDYQIKQYEKYNKTIADLDVSKASSMQVEAMFRKIGNQTLAEINKFDSIYKGKTLEVT